jgi:hypothetical protein
MSEHLSKLIEGLALAWLVSSDIGRQMRATMTTDEALDAVFELLNAGFLKIAVDSKRQPTGFTFSPEPHPSSRPISRPTRPIH